MLAVVATVGARRLQTEVDQARELDLSDYVKSLTAELASRTHVPPPATG